MPRLGFSVRPMHVGIGAIALAFLGLAALVTAGTRFPIGSQGAGPQDNASAGRTAPADRLEARASDVSVVDGSTLRLADRVVRLAGIDTPARGQACQASGFDCGAASTAALAALVRDRRVACEVRDANSMGRPLAICAAGGTELNHALVAAGWARAGSAASVSGARAEDLGNAEKLARAEHRGLWAHRAGGQAGAADDADAPNW